ncbi:T9SS type A sorting domain-containing protein [Pontibacter sp. HSC-36F09]|uniref:Ig-like domain-containing protein n=1 Tax=Pontibacter sp. HSC-36F09 TaxID=2910966 RepID=UPI00209FC246|nr:T9SS type A sorting domain-containing protein [Pontibacter sp. HSC-36F09]MCP2043061.1 hypothetical protein [Pontibacter sp. HSC-36F09]
MKHIYTLLIALFIINLSTNAQVSIYKNDFTNGAADVSRLTFTFTKAFKPEMPGELSGSTLIIRGNNGSRETRGYTGHITTEALKFNPGSVYTITFRVRAEAQNAQLLFQRGTTAAIAASASGTKVTGISPSSIVNATNANYTNFTANFTVNSVTTEHLAFYVSSTLDANNNNNEYLYIDEISVTRTCGIITQPTASSISRCGAGSISMSATGAPVGGSYKWYSAPTGGSLLSSTATYTNPNLTATTTYYVSAVNADGCESERTPVSATIVPKYTGLTEFAQQELTVGKPAIIQLNSVVFQNSHGVTVRWEAYDYVTRVRKDLGTTVAPKGSAALFSIASVESNTYYEAFIEIVGGVCYDDYLLTASTQGIISLPVELVSFKAQAAKDGVQLSWKTASERDNKGFEVEVSADGKNFRKVAFVESKVGTTSLTQTYSFLDTRAAAGTNYYRLKQVDFDGAFEYSKIVAVNMTQASSSAVYPTLATSDITVSLTSSHEQVTIAVADMAGKQLLTVQNPTERQVILPVQQLQQGVYFVTVISGTQKEVFRFVKR